METETLKKTNPALKGFVFWDKDGNGEHNSSNEPSVQTNEDGFFAFEWISSKYPVSLELDSKIEDSNGINHRSPHANVSRSSSSTQSERGKKPLGENRKSRRKTARHSLSSGSTPDRPSLGR